MEDLMTYIIFLFMVYGFIMLFMPYIKIFFLIILPFSIALLIISSILYRKILEYVTFKNQHTLIRYDDNKK